MTTPEKLNILISTISAVATIAAAIIYFKTLKTLKKQTSNTYRPRLFIDSISFSVLGVKKNNFIMPTYWTKSKVNSGVIVDFDQEQNNHNFDLKCYNIGFGTAKKISVSFNYDFRALLKRIDELKPFIDKNKVIEINSSTDMISFSTKNKNLPYMSRGISFKNSLSEYSSYILPVNISNTFAPIRIPILYPELLNIFIYYLSTAKETKGFNIDAYFSQALPDIKCLITYEDISNKKKTLSIRIKVSIFSFGINGYRGQFKIIEE